MKWTRLWTAKEGDVTRQVVEVAATTTVSAEHIFVLLADRAKVPLWSPARTCHLYKPGPEDPEGVGAIRKQDTGGSANFVTIVELAPPKRFAYAHHVLPVNEYRGVVELNETSTGCVIHWSATFEPRHSAMSLLLRSNVRRTLQRHADALAEYATHDDHTQ